MSNSLEVAFWHL